MKKIWIVLLLVTTLSACQDVNIPLAQRYEQALTEALSMPIAKHRSMNRSLFSYYLPLHMGRKTSTTTSAQFKTQAQTIVLSLDIINILNQEYYRDLNNPIRSALRKDNAVFVQDGYFGRFDGVRVPFLVIASQLSDHWVFVQIQTDTFILSSIHPQSISANLLIDMMSIARTTQVNRDLIIAQYSNRDVITYQRENLNIFSQIAPESGTVIDMITDPDSIVFETEFVETYEAYLETFE